MTRRHVAKLLVWVACALVVTLSGRARASILPACENKQESRVVEVPEPSCTVVESIDEETGETSAAPICDQRGASMIAPQRILPIGDATLDAVPCVDSGFASLVAPAPRQPTLADALSPPDPAMLTLAVLAPRADVTELAPYLPPSGAPRAGVARDLERPPR